MKKMKRWDQAFYDSPYSSQQPSGLGSEHILITPEEEIKTEEDYVTRVRLSNMSSQWPREKPPGQEVS